MVAWDSFLTPPLLVRDTLMEALILDVSVAEVDLDMIELLLPAALRSRVMDLVVADCGLLWLLDPMLCLAG